jgi:hypothetical protein
MHTNATTSLRHAWSALVLALLLCPVAAHAYTSTGSDGLFQPTASTVLDPAASIFNFTSIFIPAGVTVSFGGLASAQPIELLATGNIDIEGTLDAGANSLWIQTPGDIAVPGSLRGSGNLSLFAGNTVNLGGAGGIYATGGGGITIGSGGATLTGGGGTLLTGGGSIITGGGGGILTGGSGLSCSGNCSGLMLTVPEPHVWAMFPIGMLALFAALRIRRRSTPLA